MFRTALKLIARLCASTHATKYVSMITDFLTDWYCASDADKVIFTKAVLTRDTLHGKKIFTDRFVEWMMKDFRVWLGKYSTSHHESLFEKVALGLVRRKQLLHAANQLKGEFKRRTTKHHSRHI